MSIQQLIFWSEKEFSFLPWRKDRSLYRTLVSEIMLQQTTVGTVRNHYDRFLLTFPTLESLAKASEDELTVAWKGLGYYRRARNLKKIAEAIVQDYAGEFPTDLLTLQEIPGIGPYTSSAIRAIGMNLPALAVDANLERVIARLFGIKIEKGPKLQKKIQEMFAFKQIFADKKLSPRGLNEALMDLGRTYCQARKASCDLCFLKNDCVAFKSKKPTTFPLEKAGLEIKKEHDLHLLRVYIIKGDKLLVYKKDKNEWLSGQYEVPTFILKTSDSKLTQYPIFEGKTLKSHAIFKTSITKYKIQNLVFMGDEKVFKRMKFSREVEWRDLGSADSNFSTATLKGIKCLFVDKKSPWQ